ncbi:pyridoxamine 5'-phosphate oxidase family protein [Streptomyces sp. BE303]|uniref:pyridoxamine 5'-phosphate oxidase family protein n=1 Tax=Streptomyces sp. BE303 TaxID=3002528 RepID=UPI002E78DE65|nr:pyridoxamine 5'-phosphate oxidase family protein [Streptomyces sp. BE303]MED7955075.1 pyridoxamine 5'-phosphate oxidase family protein [Streptomyces sp. BE303]
MTVKGGEPSRARPFRSHEAEDTPAGPGDTGRRIALRRRQLGLSRAEAAARAGMAEEYLESSPVAVEAGALLRLAHALETTSSQLLGGGLDVPPSRAAAAARPVLTDLSVPECWGRLAPGGVGRVAFTTAEGPVVLPVNYRVLDGSLLFRTSARGVLATVLGARIAFEVDRIDDASRTGWSVLAMGRATAFDEPEAIEHLVRRDGPDPWAGGPRDVWVRLRPASVTGRAVHTPEEPEEAVPDGGR